MCKMKLETCNILLPQAVIHLKIWVGKELVRQTQPLPGKSVLILFAAYIVGISLQNHQILFLLKTTIEAATRHFGIWLHS